MRKRLFTIIGLVILNLLLITFAFSYDKLGIGADAAIDPDPVLTKKLQSLNIDHISGMVASCEKQQMHLWGKDKSGKEVYITKVDIGTGRKIISYSDYNRLKAKGAISQSDLDRDRYTSGFWPKDNPQYVVLAHGNVWARNHPAENVKLMNCMPSNIKNSNTTPKIDVSASSGKLKVKKCPASGCISGSSSDANMGPYILIYDENRGLYLHGKLPDVASKERVPQTHGCIRFHNGTMAALYPYMTKGVSKKDLRLIVRN